MKLNKFQKAKIVLGLSLVGLLFAILFVPHVVDHGLSWASEDTMESLFLALSFFSVVYIFWHYDYVVQKREQETFHLSSKLKSKEKELIEAFQYLGKVNVRFSVIKDFLDIMKKPVPENQKEMKVFLMSILDIACGASGKNQASIKIVDIENKKFLIEENLNHGSKEKKGKDQLQVGDFLKPENNKGSFKVKEGEVFSSEKDDPRVMTFLILPLEEDLENQREDFLRALANQCRIIFLLYSTRDCKIKNRE